MKVRPESSSPPLLPLAACGSGAGCDDIVCAVSGVAGVSSALSVAAGGAVSAGASAPPASPTAITAMRVFTGTVSPSLARISRTIPDAGDGISVSTLSVEISTIVSSASMWSPTCFIQRVIVPSDTLTPICGITTSTTVPVAMRRLLVLIGGEAFDAGQHVSGLGQVRLLERW